MPNRTAQRRAMRLSLAYGPQVCFLAPPFRVSDLYGQSLPDPLWWRGESLKTTHDHSAR